MRAHKRSSHTRHRVAVAALALVCSVAATAALGAGALASPPPLGKAAPTFRLRDRSGALVALSDLSYSGAPRPHQAKQIVVLDFFRTDCAPCRASMPKLVALHKRYARKRVKVLLVALLEAQDGEKKLDRYLARRKLPFAVLVDSYGIAGKKYVKQGSAFRIPALFVVDRDGVLRRHITGRDDKAFATLYPLIDKLLGQK